MKIILLSIFVAIICLQTVVAETISMSEISKAFSQPELDLVCPGSLKMVGIHEICSGIRCVINSLHCGP